MVTDDPSAAAHEQLVMVPVEAGEHDGPTVRRPADRLLSEQVGAGDGDVGERAVRDRHDADLRARRPGPRTRASSRRARSTCLGPPRSCAGPPDGPSHPGRRTRSSSRRPRGSARWMAVRAARASRTGRRPPTRRRRRRPPSSAISANQNIGGRASTRPPVVVVIGKPAFRGSTTTVAAASRPSARGPRRGGPARGVRPPPRATRKGVWAKRSSVFTPDVLPGSRVPCRASASSAARSSPRARCRRDFAVPRGIPRVAATVGSGRSR